MTKYFAISFFLIFSAIASNDSSIESKVQSDLQDLLSKIIPRSQFLVQASAPTEVIQERRLVEGETLVQNSGNPQVDIPILPGFQRLPTPKNPPTVPSTNRQVFRMVDKTLLSSVQVQLAIDESVPEEVIKRAESLVRKYLEGNFGAKGRLVASRVNMIQNDGTPASSANFSEKWIVTLLVLLLAAALITIYLQARRKSPAVLNPTILDDAPEERPNRRTPTLGISGKTPLALPSGKPSEPGKFFPSIPATEEFVDRRAELLRDFLKHSEIFRGYFNKLHESAQSELYAGLRGPAFDSLLIALSLDIPPGGDTIAPPSEEQLLFYRKNFGEFIEAHLWQNAQFFGFLYELNNEELLTLTKSENALVSALMIKFLNPDQSAALLSSVSSTERLAILSQFSRVQQIQAEELRSIERSVRERVELLPRFLSGNGKSDDLQFWTRILSKTENQEAILMDLQETRPDLYANLARFRFRLEDAPSIPTPLVSRVLEEVENDELALALLSCSKDVTEFLLAELNTGRRALVRSQMDMYQGIQSTKRVEAQSALTGRFREVML